MKTTTILKFIWLWPPFLGAGIWVSEFSPDILSIRVDMKLRFWNKNYFGTQFGGSLFSMTDPFFALMLIEHLGKDYIVWDKSSTIDFKNPGRGKVHATFQLSQDVISQIKLQADSQDKVEPVFTVQIYDEEDVLVANLQKVLYIKRKVKS